MLFLLEYNKNKYIFFNNNNNNNNNSDVAHSLFNAVTGESLRTEKLEKRGFRTILVVVVVVFVMFGIIFVRSEWTLNKSIFIIIID